MRNAFSSSAFGASASDATKLPLTGGTLTGSLTISTGGIFTPQLANTANQSSIAGTIFETDGNGVKIRANSGAVTFFHSGGSFLYATTASSGVSSTQLGLGASATAPDVFLNRAAAAVLRLGVNHATTATNQTIQAHNVTTGTGADLCLKGGTGSVANGVVSFGVRSAIGAETITGFITIKDEGGTVRKLAVVS